MERYDEDITENSFFQELECNFDDMYDRAASEKWIIGVPRTGQLPNCTFTKEDFENHILIPTDDDPTEFKTLNGKEVKIINNVITTGKNFSELQTTHILFEELFYNKTGEKFRVLCLESLLEGIKAEALDGRRPSVVELRSMKECTDILWRAVGDQRIFYHVDELIENWNSTHVTLEFENLQFIRDLASALYTTVLQAVLKDPSLKKKVWKDKFLMEAIKLAVETYTMHGIYKRVMKGVTAYLGRDDAHLNKTVRNLSDLQMRDLNIRPEFTSTVPRARQELSKIDWFGTPLEKIGCIKRAVLAITLTSSPKSSPEKTGGSAMSTDDLLPILVFLVLKIGMPNWLAHLAFMRNFRLSQNADDGEKDEQGFYLASLEAAIEHVRSGSLMGSTSPECLLEYEDTVDCGMLKLECPKDESLSSVKAFFECIKCGRLEDAVAMLEMSETPAAEEKPDLCHPLCSCDKCEQQQKRYRCQTAPTVSSRDDRGMTAIHIAASYSRDLVVDMLINRKADVNATDYRGCTPLHLACQRGCQNATLLLLYHGASINVVDNDGNTPLHLCACNGHEDCVKALIYYDEHTKRSNIQLNATNDNGDTPLHFAARWGYDGIVSLLLDYGACAEARNRRKQTPVDCAHSVNVLRLLEKASEEKHANRNCGFIAIESISPPTVATVTVAQSATDRSKVKSSSPASANVMIRINRLMKAVAKGDVNLACFYLGIEYEMNHCEEAGSESTGEKLCHPLCQCLKCKPMQQPPQSVSSANGQQEHVAVNSSNADGQTALHVASMHGHVALVKILLKNGANPSASRVPSPLHLACQHNQHAVVDVLLKHLDLLNTVDSGGYTPLSVCCIHGRTDLAKKLIQNGAEVNKANLKGNTALHEAVWRNHQPLVTLLLSHNADVNLANKQQLTPKDLAKDAAMLRLLGEGSVSEVKPTSESQPATSAGEVK